MGAREILSCSSVMWDSPLYAVNVFYYPWFIKKLLWPMAGQNKARWEIQRERERVGGVRETLCSCPRTKGITNQKPCSKI